MVDEPREGDQPLPIPNDSIDIQTLVIRDIRNRREVGIGRYGTALQANNGRDALQDAYEESLDQTCYLRQLIEERRKYREGENPSDVPDAAADARFWVEHPLAGPGTRAYDHSESDRVVAHHLEVSHPEGHPTVRGKTCMAVGRHVSNQCIEDETKAIMQYGDNSRHFNRDASRCIVKQRHTQIQCVFADQFADPKGV